MQNFIRRRSRRVVAAAMLAALPSVSPAATFIWTGGDALHGYFSAGDNWAGNSPPPTSGADLIFAGTNAQNSAPFAETAYSINSINFSTGAYAYSGNQQIEANVLTIGVGGIIDLASNLETISNPIALSAGETWNVSGGNFNTTGSVILGINGLTAYVPSGSMSFNGALTCSSSSTGTFGKTGAGLLTINAGSTSDSVGVISLAQGTTNLSGGTVITTQGSGNSYVDANPGNTATLNITGAGSYLNASSSPFYISNGTGHSGTVNITSSGELISSSINLPGSGGAGVLNVLSGGIVQTSLFNLGPTTASGATGNIVISGSGSSITATNFGLGAGTGTSGTLTINNSGGLVVSNVTGFGAGAFSINVSGGSYSTGALNSLSPTGGQINLNNGNSNTGLTIQAGAGVVGDYFGGLSGSGIVVKSGASEQIIDASATVSGLTVSGGIFQISTGTFKVTGTLIDVTVNGSGSLIVNHGATLDASALITNNYIDGAGAGPTMTVDGTGSQYKVGSILDVGFTAGDKGTLIVSNSGQVSSTTLNLPLHGTGIMNVNSNGVVNAGTMTIGGSSGGSLLTVSGGGSVVVTGTTNFADAFSSTVNISGGSLTTGALFSTASLNGQIVLTADPTGGTALVINGASGTSSYSGTINQAGTTSGGIQKSGGSTQTFSGPVNFVGPLTVTGGALAFNSIYTMAVGSATVTGGALNVSAGTLQLLGPNLLNVSGGSLNVTSGATLLANAAANVTIDGTTTPTVNVTGSGSVFNASSLSVNVGTTVGHSGVLNVNSGAVFDANVLAVPGLGGNGTLNVSSGGIVNCGALYLDFGSQTGSCVAILSGAGSQINTGALTLSSSNNPGSFTIANAAILNIPTVLTFTTSAFPINVSGGSLTAAGLNSQGTGVSGAVNLLGDPAGGYALTLNGSSGTYGYSGSFSGPGTLVKNGNATQIYTGTGSIGLLAVDAGAFNVTGGSLTLSNTSGGLFVSGGSFLINGGATVNANAVTNFNLVDGGSMTVTGSGTKFLGGAEFDVGEYATTPNILTVSSGAQMSTGLLAVPYYSTGNMTVTSNAQVSAGTLDFGGFQSLASSLVVSAGGSLIVGGLSNFMDTVSTLNVSGGTFSTSGLVSASGKGLIALTDPSGGTALNINGTSGTNTYSGKLTGTGTLLKTGGSTQVLANSTSSIGTLAVQAGAFNVTGGSLTLTQPMAPPINVTGGTLTINNAATVKTGVGVTGTVYVGGSAIPANLTVSGAGSSLVAPNYFGVNYLGTLTATQQGSINIGNLELYSISSAMVINSGGTVSSQYDGIAFQVGAISTVTVDGQGSSWKDVLLHVGGYGSTGGTATITITSLATVTASNKISFESNSATINVSGGTITAGALTSLSNGNGTILLTDPALATALTLNDATASDTETYSGTISGTGSLNKTGAYTQILAGNNIFTGAVAVNGGMLTMRGSSASLYQITNGTLNFNSQEPETAPIFVESGGILTGSVPFLSMPVTLLPGGTFLPGAFNGSFPGITGASALIQPAVSGSTSTFAAITLNAPATLSAPSGSSLFLFDNLIANNNAITKTGGGSVLTSTFQSKALNISSGTLQLDTQNSNGPLLLGTLTISSGSQLDIDKSPVDITITSLTAITSYVQSGFNNGAWNGSGIKTFDAANNSSHLTAIGVIQNNQSGTALYTLAHQFEGITPGVADVLAKYTYYGDANLDGKVDGSDYSRIDAAYLADQTNSAAATGWFNGDFNYDGVVNGSDYTLIDNAFNTQGALLLAELALPTSQIAGTSSAVPEPSSVALAVAFGSAGLSRRRRNIRT